MKQDYIFLNSYFEYRKALIIFSILFFLFSPKYVYPQGANCAGATSLTINGACGSGSISNTAQDAPNIGTCPGTFNREGWYTFTVTGGPLNVTITAEGNNRNLYLQLISSTASCTGLAQIACANATDSNGTQTETISQTLNNGIYYIKVVNVGSNGNLTLNSICVTGTAPVANDNCGGAIGLTVNPGATCGSSTSGTTVGATQSLVGCAGTADDDVWYSFTATSTAHTITVTPGTLNNAIFEVFNSCGGTSLGCVNDTNSSNPELRSFTGLTVGVTYYVRIYSSNSTNGSRGTFTICVTTPSDPCSSITNIAACGSAVSTSIPAGTGLYSTSSCGYLTMGNEAIYSFTPSTTGNYAINQSSSFGYIDYMYKAASSGCNSTGWTCISALTGSAISGTFALTAGTQYYFLLDAETTTGGGVVFTLNCPPVPMTNNECSGAIPLTVNSICSYTTFTSVGATASTGIPAPGCANYSGADVWFSAVVPPSGILTVDSQVGTITDSGMAFYSGTCGALTLLECDDDDSDNGNMSSITMVGLTPGQTIYIRFWRYGGGTGTFGLCASTPSCPQPADLYANILSTTSVTVNWAAPTPPASGGYQYYITTTNTPPSPGTTPTGSTPPGVISVTLTGLTQGQIYYFWIRSFCGGSDISSWFGPTNYTPCAVGNGTGTTTLACPSALTGGLGLNGANPPAVACSGSTCVNLEATYLQVNQPTTYTVTSIPYAPPYQFSCLQNPVSVNIDDRWSPVINLPFDFCFFGNNFTKCLIGSNGVLTFDTTNYAPGGWNEWQFNADLPNASLFRNTIFGVYHDIDPSIGGKVSWELITLNTGCRALVAAWDDIPMFSSTCNSMLYTGMIVLYENTNVIEIYIKEKRVCATWNDGNAIVGIQNAAGNAAVVAPNRNGLSTNWSATNEAWRFTPSGPSLTSIQWYVGNNPTVGTPIPGATSSTLNVCPLATTVYSAEVSYAMCNGTNLKFHDNTVVTVTGGKVWNGSVDSDWNKPANWTPNTSIPTSTDCVVIPNTTNKPVVSGTSYNALAGTLSVYANALLTINSGNSITVTDWVNVQANGTFAINNNASLVQINNVANTGNIVYRRNATVRGLDYVYWSSPVAGVNISNIASPSSFWGIYKWNTTVANSNGGQGNWESAAGDTMIAGKGYIASAPSGFSPQTPATFTSTFTGVPNNGTITIPIARGNDTNTSTHYGINGAEITNYSDNWNLLGNPYPSAIRASQFLFDNNTKIMGNVRLWTHGTLPSIIPSPFYGSFISNYNPGDYVTYNFTGTSCCPAAASDLFIGSGQGFFVQMIDGPAATNTVTFNNNLRSNTYSNSDFYKFSNSNLSNSVNVDSIERNRIWLDLIDSNNVSDRTLFGYIENATMGNDNFYDCVTQNTGTMSIYSLIEDTKFSIQGRALPFDVLDEVPIGINIPAAGNYSIGLAAIDGLFSGQNIYLKDNTLDIIHDLKASPYQFTSEAGTIHNRFKVVYVNQSLNNAEFSSTNNVRILIKDAVSVSSSNLNMESIIVYNVLGQKLDRYENLNTNFFTLSNLRKNNSTLLLNIKLQTGETVIRKVVY